MNNQLVTIQVFMNEIEAEIAKGRLLSEGIDAFIFKDDCGGMYPPLRLSQGVALKVPADQADAAAEALALDDEPETTVSGEDASADNIGALLSLLAWMAVIPGAGLVFLGFFDPPLFRIGVPLSLAGLILAYLTRKI